MPETESLSRQQVRSFHLAGTVALPTPFPEVGRLTYLPDALELAGAEPVDLLAIAHEQTSRVTVTRTVRLADVAGVLFVRPLPPMPCADDEWAFGPEVAAALQQRSALNDPTLLEGIAYVREAAPVLMQVEVGLTAAESAEYYPPVLGDRTDAHYRLGEENPLCDGGWCERLKERPAAQFLRSAARSGCK